MQFRKLSAIFLLFLTSFAISGVAPSKSELESMYDKAFRLSTRQTTMKRSRQLDAIDARQPDLAESQNLRGVVYMRQGKYDQSGGDIPQGAVHRAEVLERRFQSG